MSDPTILVRLTAQLAERGVDDPRTVAIAKLVSYGILYRDTTDLTPNGRIRDQMSPADRAIDRQSRQSSRDPADYDYDPRTNRATLHR